MIKHIYPSLQSLVAGLMVILLPFTSFPLVARLTGSTMVAPLSLVPMVLLAIVWFPPYILRRGKLPPQSLPVLGFALVSILSAAAAFYLSLPPFRSTSLLRNEVEAIATLAVGLGFYLVTSVWAQKIERVQLLLRLVNWSGVVMLSWAMIQAVTWRWLHYFPDWMWYFQGAVSTSLLLYPDRANGFAYEPSWLAHQLNMVYLPLWLAATTTGMTVHKHRIWKFSLENFLFIGGVVVLVLSVSRIGLLAFLAMVAYQFFLWNVRLVKWLPGYVVSRIKAGGREIGIEKRISFINRSVLAVSILVVILVYSTVLVGAAYGLSQYDARMKSLFDFSTIREKSFSHYANQLVFAERIVFWQAGWAVFSDYPILGVGPGNAGFLFPEKLSAFSWALTEVRTLMYHWSSLPNIKSLWVRILAETGVAGFAFFACWYVLLWHSALFLSRIQPSSQPVEQLNLARLVGLAGSFVLVAIVIEGFSIDTFALPYYWFSFGILTAICETTRQYFAPMKGSQLEKHGVETVRGEDE